MDILWTLGELILLVVWLDSCSAWSGRSPGFELMSMEQVTQKMLTQAFSQA
jgi:hypothetical protein